jgi:glycosyltransferase involved in cell wall biosynthesis
MKLVIQIPCYNEEEALPVTLASLPKAVSGIDEIEVLIIDDGSSDRTVVVAKNHGAHVISHAINKGLATAFATGLRESLRLDADIIVNLDADNQYNADDIKLLVGPILDREAEVVIGARPIHSMPQFSPAKKFFQYLGSLVVRLVSKTNIEDAPSGFRAISKRAARRINITSTFTYTAEMIIQLGALDIPMLSIPIRVNESVMRPSRLMKSNVEYVARSTLIILCAFARYRPIAFALTCLGLLLLLYCIF